MPQTSWTGFAPHPPFGHLHSAHPVPHPSGGFAVQPGSDLEKLQGSYMWSAGLRIAGGTDEILRNIIAERVLGLPGDLRPDKDIPFSQLKPL